MVPRATKLSLPLALPRTELTELTVSTGEIAGIGTDSIMSALTDTAIVKKELLTVVAGGDQYRVNNKHDDKYPPFPATKIVQQAKKLVGQVVHYSLTSKNCEHFVNEMRYGIPISDQVSPQPVSPFPGTRPSLWVTCYGWTRMVIET
jgi:hypothetical protein